MTVADETVSFPAKKPRRVAGSRFYVLRRLFQKEKLAKVFVERLTEPLHLNLLSLPVALFGSYRLTDNFGESSDLGGFPVSNSARFGVRLRF